MELALESAVLVESSGKENWSRVKAQEHVKKERKSGDIEMQTFFTIYGVSMFSGCKAEYFKMFKSSSVNSSISKDLSILLSTIV